MKSLKQSIYVRLILVLTLALVVYLGFNLRTRYFSTQPFLETRPVGKNAYVYDYAGILADTRESTARFLEGIESDYAIDAVIVTATALPPTQTIESLAAELFSNWKIGQTTDGRGVLLILSA